VHVRADVAGDIGRVVRIVSGRALGLVLAGGAARGFAHLGVYRALQELDLPVDWIGGTSLGAIMAATLASPYALDDSVRIAREAFVKGKPFSDFTLPLVSLIGGRRMDRLLRTHLDLMIEDLPTLFLLCLLPPRHRHDERTSVGTSRTLCAPVPPFRHHSAGRGRRAAGRRRRGDQQSAGRHHAAKPVGTIVAVDLSADQVVAVDYANYPRPGPSCGAATRPSRASTGCAWRRVLLKATELGTLEHVRKLGAEADLPLRPPVRQFGMTEVKSFDRIVQAGYQHARQELEAWLERRRKAGCLP
jgi:predicted acylesterase/phospholipase RssA